MSIASKVKTNLTKFVPAALRKRFGMAHRKPRKRGRGRR